MSVNLVLGDCMEYLAKMPDDYFDLAIVDPPYGIGAAKMTLGRGSCIDKGTVSRKDWDSDIPPPEYFDELFRVSKNQVIWGGNYFLDHLGAAKCFLIWDKLDYNSDFSDAELAWTSFDKVTKIFQRSRSAEGDHRFKIHPTQKPIRLYQWILETFSDPSHKVIDTHLGSGSSAIAAHYFGCEFVGIEKDEEYYNKAFERFTQDTKQEVLF